MNEYDIAVRKVLPYIQDELKWPKNLLSAYGRVPVQVGGGIVWADFVCYISKGQKLIPWLLIEVKKLSISLEEAAPQAESYSLILGAPFFCVTDGRKYEFYMTGNSQGDSVRLFSPPPLPDQQYLEAGADHISFTSEIDNLVELFMNGLRQDPKFLEDTRWHNESVTYLHQKVFTRLEMISPEELKEALEGKRRGGHLMIKPPNRNMIYAQIDKDFEKFRKSLLFIRDFSGDAISNINMLLDKRGEFYVQGGGIFFITQLLAAAHPDQYVVLEENVSRALRNLGITEIFVKNDTANGYIYINDICKKLFKDKMEKSLKDYGFGLATVHQFLWHYYVYYRKKRKWFP